jgi:hypothetical protein
MYAIVEQMKLLFLVGFICVPSETFLAKAEVSYWCHPIGKAHK